VPEEAAVDDHKQQQNDDDVGDVKSALIDFHDINLPHEERSP
jgi:hypothetical protein